MPPNLSAAVTIFRVTGWKASRYLFVWDFPEEQPAELRARGRQWYIIHEIL